MAHIELVIKISEDTVAEIKDNAMFAKSISSDIRWDITSAIIMATPLPKGHDRLIEANSVDKTVKSIEPSDAEWGMTAETAIRLIHDAFDNAPTIIEADKGDKE